MADGQGNGLDEQFGEEIASADELQAQLAEAYRDMDTLPQGAGKEPRVLSALEVRVDGFNQQLRWAIADLQDKPRTIVELL